MYLGGGWAVGAPEGQVRRRVVGEGLGEGVSLELFGVRNGENGINWGKIYVLLWEWDWEGIFFCALEGKMEDIG